MESIGADGLTFSQWLETSSPDADQILVRSYQQQNRESEIKEKKQKQNNGRWFF